MGVGHTIGKCSTPSQTSVGQSPTQSACGTAADNGGSGTSPASSIGTTQQQGTDTRSLAIGLRVGIPLGIALICALVFVGYQMRKKGMNLDTTSSTYHAEKPPSQFSSPNQPNPTYWAATGASERRSPTATYSQSNQTPEHNVGRPLRSFQHDERREDASRVHEMSSVPEVHEIGGR